MIFLTIEDNGSESNFKRYIKVGNGKVEMFVDKPIDSILNCSVTLSKDTLMCIIGGVLDPMIAFMCGNVKIDDPMALVAFIQAFELNPQKFEQFQHKLEETALEVKEPVINLPSSNQSNLSSLLFAKSLKLLESAGELAIELKKNRERLLQNERYIELMAKLEETKQNIYESSTYQSVQNNPSLIALREYFLQQWNIYNIPYEEYKNKASEYLITYFLYITSPISKETIPSKEERKKQLLEQLEKLQTQNRQLEEARKERLKNFFNNQK